MKNKYVVVFFMALGLILCLFYIKSQASNIIFVTRRDQAELWAMMFDDIGVNGAVYKKIATGDTSGAQADFRQIFSLYKAKIKILNRLGCVTSGLESTELYQDAMRLADE